MELIEKSKPLDAPVALFIYNRPAHLRQVFDVVRRRQPATLFVVADGPKDAADAAACHEARAVVTTGVNWPCRLVTHFRSENVGTALGVSTGLDWVFGQVDRAIILEDDCIADLSFFDFCESLLERYAAEERVMQISGTNLAGHIEGHGPYGFTRFGLPCWGWATWARAWRHFDFSLSTWDKDRESIERDLGLSSPFWLNMVDRYQGKLHGWDVQWQVAMWRSGGRVVIPAMNLVSNIGYGEGATYTKAPVSRYANLARFECVMPLPNRILAADLGGGEEFDRLIEPKAIDLIRELGQFYRARGFGPERELSTIQAGNREPVRAE